MPKCKSVQLVLRDPHSFAIYRKRENFVLPPYGPFLKAIIEDPEDEPALERICWLIYAALALHADQPMPRFDCAFPTDTEHLSEDFLATHPDIYTLPEGQLKTVSQIIEGIAQINASRFDVGVERLILAIRHSWNDKKHNESVIDTAIGLESIFNDHEHPISYTIAIRAACLLEAASDRRRSLFKFLKVMYGIRSQLVHGNPIKESSTKGYQEAADWVGHEIKSREELARTYRTVLRQSLVKVASENVTISGEEFDSRVLGRS